MKLRAGFKLLQAVRGGPRRAALCRLCLLTEMGHQFLAAP